MVHFLEGQNQDMNTGKNNNNIISWGKRFLKYTLYLHLIFFFIMTGPFLFLKYKNPPFTSLMQYRKHFFSYSNKPVKYLPLDEIPVDFKKMIVATEDYRFFNHRGISLEAITRAYVINSRVGYRMYGGSTITQQLARSLFLVPQKILLRKYIEILISLEMELFLSKERILELYLNYCELGRGIYGIGMAAEEYFGKEVGNLAIDEIARIITIFASPVKYTPFSFMERDFLSYRYYFIKFRYYTYKKFQNREKDKLKVVTTRLYIKNKGQSGMSGFFE
jgi:monofunctional biosynthetic peptidoglycan transglycosylase